MSATSPPSLKNEVLGFTLIELMIAASIGLLLVSISLTIYLSSQKSLRIQLALNQLQMNEQKAHYLFQHVLEHIGRLSCFSITSEITLMYPPYRLSRHHLLGGSQNELIVHYVDYPGSALLSPIQNHSLLTIDLNKRFSPRDILVISDCRYAEMFQVQSLNKDNHKQLIVTAKPLKNTYEKYAEIGHFKMDCYHVKPTQRFNDDGSPIYALFVTSHNRTEELVENVESMHIVFSIIKNGKRIEQSPPVTDDATIVGVSIRLQLKSAQLNKMSYHYFSLREANV